MRYRLISRGPDLDTIPKTPPIEYSPENTPEDMPHPACDEADGLFEAALPSNLPADEMALVDNTPFADAAAAPAPPESASEGAFAAIATATEVPTAPDGTPAGEEGQRPSPLNDQNSGDDGNGASPAPKPKKARKPFNYKKLLRAVPTTLIAIIYAVLSFIMFSNAQNCGRGETLMSMRYYTPLPAEIAASSKHTMGNPDVKSTLRAAYWQSVQKEHLESKTGNADTPALFVDGDMESVIQVDFLYGTYPAALETHGLALSEGLAWSVFGGVNIVGTTVDWHEEQYTVRGIFKGDEPMLLAEISVSKSPVADFGGIELAGEIEGDPRAVAKEYITAAGLPEPEVMMNTTVVPGIVSAMAWVPLLALLLWLVFRLLKLLRHVVYWKRQLVWFCILLAAAITLPKAMALLPGWMIPSQWSDFEYWGKFFLQLNSRIDEMLSLRPYFEDVQLKRQLISQVVLLFPVLFSITSLMHRWGDSIRRKDEALAAQHLPTNAPEFENEGSAGSTASEQNTEAPPED